MSLDDNYTKVLLHMNGINLSNDFSDDSGKTWTAYSDYDGPLPSGGGAYTNTTAKKFGSASGKFIALYEGYISTPDSADFYFGSNPFCIDFWMRLASIPAAGSSFRVFGQQTDTNNYMRLAVARDAEDTTTSLSFLLKTSGSSLVTLQRDVTMSAFTWYHVAISREGDNIYMFLNGSLLTPSVSYTGAFANISAPFIIGQAGSDRYYNGWIDEFRLSKGVARWTDSFTPPTAEYSSNNKFGETGIFFD